MMRESYLIKIYEVWKYPDFSDASGAGVNLILVPPLIVKVQCAHPRRGMGDGLDG